MSEVKYTSYENKRVPLYDGEKWVWTTFKDTVPPKPGELVLWFDEAGVLRVGKQPG